LDAGAPPEAVVPLFEAAAAEGHAEATFFVGLAKAGLLEPDDGTVGGSPPEVDLEGAAEAYAKAAELGCAPAAFNYAHALRRGDGVPRDEKRAYDYYQQASELGDARAAFQLGLAADPLHGDVSRPGGAKDGDAAVAHYRQAMDAGHFKAAVNLGILHWAVRKSNFAALLVNSLVDLRTGTGNPSRSPSSKCPRRTGELSP
jgi:TPR repeat protein